jgi:NHL repeat
LRSSCHGGEPLDALGSAEQKRDSSMPFPRLIILIASLAATVLAIAAAPASANLVFTGQLGSPGSGDGQFLGPVDAATDASGNVYVVDISANRVQKFDSSGNFVAGWGGLGGGNGELNSPFGIVVDGGAVYVTDSGNDRIEKFGLDGSFLGAFGSSGAGPGQFSFPTGIASDANGNLYVSDTLNARIEKLTPAGGFISQRDGTDGSFIFPWGLETDLGGNLYATDGTSGVLEFSPGGAHLATFGGGATLGQTFGVTVDGGGNVYATDTFAGRIQQYGPDGSFKGTAAGPGSGLVLPWGIALDRPSGRMYVADPGGSQVEIFSLPTPKLHLPADFSVNATSPAGAAVPYTATATEVPDLDPVVDCSPVSGATFAIGDTVVHCTATDSYGTTANGSFNVHVKSAMEQLQDLIATIQGYGLTQRGTEQSLTAKLNAAMAASTPADAVSALNGFLSEAAAQRGKKLSTAQADQISADARRIQAVLG